jgi:RimJ/RimL family protein N-acetyltransferase
MENEKLELKILKDSEENITAVQRVFEETPTYCVRVTGHTATREDAEEIFSSIAPGKEYKDKFVFGIYLDNHLIGCIDLCRGYPDELTVMLGLLLLSEKYQRKGFGTQAHKKLEEIIKGWGNFDKIRIGVLITNQEILPFWKKIGYTEKAISPYKHGDIETEVITLNKPIVK